MANAFISVKINGLDKLTNTLTRFGDNASKVLSETMLEEAHAIMANSQLIVPVDTGALRSSGAVKDPVIEGKKITVTMFYGGPSAPYALFVHEIGAYKHAPPTQYKFLEVPTMQRLPVIAKNIKIRLENILKQGLR